LKFTLDFLFETSGFSWARNSVFCISFWRYDLGLLELEIVGFALDENLGFHINFYGDGRMVLFSWEFWFF
jgi:hypothetical protein